MIRKKKPKALPSMALLTNCFFSSPVVTKSKHFCTSPTAKGRSVSYWFLDVSIKTIANRLQNTNIYKVQTAKLPAHVTNSNDTVVFTPSGRIRKGPR